MAARAPAPKPGGTAPARSPQPATPDRRETARDRSPRAGDVAPRPSSDVAVGPMVRIGILVDVARVRVTGKAPLRVSTANNPPSTVTAAEVALGRVDSRPAGSGPAPYKIQVASFRERERADALVRALLQTFEAVVTSDLNESTGWFAVRLGDFNTREQAQDFLPEIEREGFADAFVLQIRAAPALAAQHEFVIASDGDTIVSTDVVFRTDGEGTIDIDGKPYRGAIHVFKNSRGRLTVVNELPIEIYLRGVVPNELSPFSFPEMDALKAQSIAARTFAYRNLGQFARQEGFDLYATDRSQVYGGVASERPLSDQAVAETARLVATFEGRPISAMYSSTCGGHTENFEAVFGGEPVPYLRGVPCLPERENSTAQDFLATRIESVLGEGGNNITSKLALLTLQGLVDVEKMKSEWFEQPASPKELRTWLERAARQSRRKPSPNWPVSARLDTIEAFAQAIVDLFFGREAEVLISSRDAQYLLQGFADAGSTTSARQKVLALLLQRNLLPIFPDTTLRPLVVPSRRYALELIYNVLHEKKALGLQQGEVVLREGDRIEIKAGKKTSQFQLVPATFFFNRVGNQSSPVRDLVLVGGESVLFYAEQDRITLLDVKLSSRGTASDRFSAYANWEVRLPLEKVQALMAKVVQVGRVTDLQSVARGISGRVIEMSVTGTRGTATLRGGRIRSALGLRDLLFALDREYESDGSVAAFIFRGKGWGHGVGLCQVGAYGLAREGYSHEQILKTYYTGIKVEKAY